MTQRAITYRRVSTNEQEAGLDAQTTAIDAAMAARGWEVVAAFTDEGLSGGLAPTARPALAEALARLDAGEADVLVVSKLDRLSRSIHDLSGLLAQADRKGWGIVLLDMAIDTTTPTGKLVAHILGSVAEWERGMIGVRTKDALAERRARGVRLGGPVTLAQETREYVAALREEGLPFRRIALRLNEEGVPTARGGTWHSSTVQHVLRSLTLDAEAAASA